MSAIPPEAARLKDLGNELLKKGKLRAAVDAYGEAYTASDSKWPVPLINRAMAHKKLSDWKAVETDCTEALRHDNRLIKAHYFLGMALLERYSQRSVIESGAERMSGAEESGGASSAPPDKDLLVTAIQRLEKALELARDWDVASQDGIWRELGRAKYLQHTADRMIYSRRTAALRSHVSALMDAEAAKSGPSGAVRAAAEMAQLDALIASAGPREPSPGSLEAEPNCFTCRLTMDLFRDPVVVPSGLSYERSALLDHLGSKDRQWDPVTRAPLTAQDLIPNHALREATQLWLDEHRYAYKDVQRVDDNVE